MLASCQLSAFYDDTVETHANVKNVKFYFGALADVSSDDTSKFQASIDWLSTNGGGDLIVPTDPDGHLKKRG
ncbi:Unannotated [Lentimonas sp. CC19]|nr:Unannotated [Lentimonas sp. CC19]CAA6693999.1 Unannotated [Lentimonas sp. CC10]CAA7072229.1 Unannotated [Lentimonas sp. CC11]